jgi:hypothetical protein
LLEGNKSATISIPGWIKVSHFGTKFAIRFLGSQVVILFYFEEMFWKKGRGYVGEHVHIGVRVDVGVDVNCSATFTCTLLLLNSTAKTKKGLKKDSPTGESPTKRNYSGFQKATIRISHYQSHESRD